MFVVVNLGEELKSPPSPITRGNRDLSYPHPHLTHDHATNNRGVIPSKQGY